MAKSRLHELSEQGVSVWIDSLSREMLETGELARLMKEDAVVGVTSNPTIFQKALSSGDWYDERLAEVMKTEDDPTEIFLALAKQDVQDACDLLRPVWDEGKGLDGWVSLEVDPTLAYDREATFEQAIRFHAEVDRPNLFVKIPATLPGLAAIEDCIAKGKAINVTLIFSLDRYAAVAEAYIKGLERLVAAGGDPTLVASVASFFVSRVDTEADRRLDEIGGQATRLKGKLAIANAKLAYRHWQETFAGPRWEFLAGKGATPQRCLWASTSTKNPEYRDVMYVEDLIGPQTVNTMPAETIVAFQDHGEVVPNTITEGVGGGAEADRAARRGRCRLRRCRRDAGGGRRAEVRRLLRGAARRDPGQASTTRDRVTSIVERIWSYDASLWTNSGEDRWLGWLDVVDRVRPRIHELNAFAEAAIEQFDAFVLLGMGGSSLAPEVLRRAFAADSFHVLDTTHPAAIRRLESGLDLERTLFIASSKSGSTIETRSHLEYFWERTGGRGAQFAAITDPGSELEQLAQERGFRATFPGEPEIGGRYSALSLFGIVPASLMGVALEPFLDRATEMMEALRLEEGNPGLELGLQLGEGWQSGRDKICIESHPSGFGLWAEQLLAESTGKQGKGLIPAPGESPDGPDRQRGEVRLPDPYELGQEWLRWEFATAVAGHVLGINPFDQPDVQAAKDKTNEVLAAGEPDVAPRGSLDELLGQASEGDYVCIQAFIDPAREGELAPLAAKAHETGCVVTSGLGPRYLHSTGQLHKGGPNTGLFIQVVDDTGEELAIPGRDFGFGRLIRSQAAGDLAALEERGRRVVRIRLEEI